MWTYHYFVVSYYSLRRVNVVFVISKEGKPLMPTKNHAKARILLKHKKAKVIRRKPFTIQLLYEFRKGFCVV
jgi:hypothetical protein